jgi:hopanoid-associated phosphorylase
VTPILKLRPVLVVTGAAFEARIVAGEDVSVICSGGDPFQLRSRLGALDPNGFRAVISFGLAGGLDPALRPGDLIVANPVIANGGTWHATPPLAHALTSALRANESMVRSLAGVDAPVMDVADKTALRTTTGAAAADMESHIVAGFAHDNKRPWASVRVICDPAQRGLPPLAQQALKPDGGIDYAAVLGSLARDPLQVPALIRTGWDTAIAVAALRRARRLLGAGFGLVAADFG